MTAAHPRLERKRRALALALVAFFLWPLVQHALVVAYDVNPWKLGGWAMYCVPAPPVVLTVQISGKEQVELDLDAQSAELQGVVRRYQQARWSLGDLAGAPDRVAATVFRDQPGAGAVEVAATRLFFERASATFLTKKHIWVFERGRSVARESSIVLH